MTQEQRFARDLAAVLKLLANDPPYFCNVQPSKAAKLTRKDAKTAKTTATTTAK